MVYVGKRKLWHAKAAVTKTNFMEMEKSQRNPYRFWLMIRTFQIPIDNEENSTYQRLKLCNSFMSRPSLGKTYNESWQKRFSQVNSDVDQLW